MGGDEFTTSYDRQLRVDNCLIVNGCFSTGEVVLQPQKERSILSSPSFIIHQTFFFVFFLPKCCQLLRKHGISVSSCSRPLPPPPLSQPRRSSLRTGVAVGVATAGRVRAVCQLCRAAAAPSRISPVRPPQPVRADDRDTNHVVERPAYVGALPKRDMSLCCCTMFYGDRLRTAQCTWW